MKKTRFFSRIFAAFLAAATAVVPLASSAVAAGSGSTPAPQYTVKIISPDVPTEGTYTYKFYQIIKGDIEADENGKHVITSPEWGDAFGSNFTSEKITISHIDLPDEDGDYKLSRDQILITSFDRNVQENKGNYGGSSGKNAWSDAIVGLYNNFVAINQSYSGTNITRLDTESTFIYSGGSAELPRTPAGFVEMLNKYGTSSSLLKAFTDLLFNGIPAAKVSDVQPEIKFLDSGYTPKEIAINGGNELTVTLDEPGYYLIACVDESGKLTNEESKNPKPVSAMLLLVGPNEEANTIVGKNTTAVATVDFKMFHETVGLNPLSDVDAAYVSNSVTKSLDLSTITDWSDETKWIDRTSFGNLKRQINADATESGKYSFAGLNSYDEYVLYRFDVTLPDNFDYYKDVGYFLAVLSDCEANNTGNSIVLREASCRPLVYVKHKDSEKPEKVCEIGYQMSDSYAEAKGFSQHATNVDNGTSQPLGNKALFIKNGGNDAKNIMYLGDLFNRELYGTGDDKNIPFKSGDHIYIYFPAFYRNNAVLSDSGRLIKSSHAWAVYSNNPHSTEKASGAPSGGSFPANRYILNGHINSGDVGITQVSETNINTYSLTVNVEGIDSNGNSQFDYVTTDFALYRLNSSGDKEYAVTYSDSNGCYIVGWYTIEQIKDKFSYWNVLDENDKIIPDNKKIGANTSDYYYLRFRADPNKKLRTIDGLAPGEYYIEELTIGKETQSNIKDYHYQAATQPFKLTINQEYNNNIASFTDENKDKIINKISVTFDQEAPQDRTISAVIVKPDPGDDKHSVTKMLSDTEAATSDGVVAVKITHNSLHLIWLPETGGIGTTIFFIVGGAIVLTAVVAIITRFRVKRERL